MQIIIFGMHRSGTSAVTRLVNLMGAYFGPEGANTGATGDNPRGLWERRDVRELNDALLRSAQADWDRVSRFTAGAVPDEVREPFDREASKLVLGLDAHRPWVVKEPRFCLLMPLWRPHLEVPVCVLVHRNPLQIAHSLCRRHHMPLVVGLALWERYMLDALAGSAGLPRILVSYNQVMADPMAAVEDLHKSLTELGIVGLRIPSRREIRSFIDPGLFHERQEEEVLHAMLNPAQLELLRALDAGTALELDELASLSAAGQEVLTLFEGKVPAEAESDKPLAASPAAELEALRQRSRTLLEELVQVEEAQRSDRTEAEVLRRENRRLMGKLVDQEHVDQEHVDQEQIADLKGELEKSKARHQRLSRAEEGRKARLLKVETTLRDMENSRSWKAAQVLSGLFGLLTLRRLRR